MRSVDQPAYIVRHHFGNGYIPGHLHEFQQFLRVQNRGYFRFHAHFPVEDNAGQHIRRCAVDVDFEKEAVQLRFRQGKGSFQFNGVLGGKHEKGGGEGMGLSHDGDAAFLHGFQQGGLGLGGGAVDFIRQHNVGEDGPFLEDEVFCSVPFLKNRGSRDVSRQ